MKNTDKNNSYIGMCPITHKKNLRGYMFIKRLMDIVISILGLVAFLPVFILTAFAIIMEKPSGPVFFSQTRVGQSGRPFKMYKFRSMVPDAEKMVDALMDQNELSGPVFKIKNDPRVTAVGRLIRKASIDELPQIINVLKGDMSIVGPRPPLPREVDEYSEFHKQRLCIKPGITCYWQICGRDKISDFDERVDLDIRYIKEMSVLTDIKIILKTIPALLEKDDAS